MDNADYVDRDVEIIAEWACAFTGMGYITTIQNQMVVPSNKLSHPIYNVIIENGYEPGMHERPIWQPDQLPTEVRHLQIATPCSSKLVTKI